MEYTFDTKHWGELTRDASKVERRTILITGPIMGKTEPEFGRVVQVRKKSGAFGSDTVLLRDRFGSLNSYHNMSFWTVSDEFKDFYEEMMSEVDKIEEDDINNSYSIQGVNKAVGFVVEGLDDTNGETYTFGLTITKE